MEDSHTSSTFYQISPEDDLFFRRNMSSTREFLCFFQIFDRRRLALMEEVEGGVGWGLKILQLLGEYCGLRWSCVSCADLGDDITDLKAAIVSLRNEILDLKALSTAPVSTISEDTFEDLIQEIQERESRKCSLIMYGVTEVGTGTADNGGDRNVVATVLDKVSVNSNFRVSRLGRLDPTRPRPRPIKIMLDSPELVQHALRNSKKVDSIRHGHVLDLLRLCLILLNLFGMPLEIRRNFAI
ncbi:hypothetical protein QE152_g19005 [Popillia japonica]|uniref:Uncharacterized protein n=1 Tax=Popillia japonica TaxID=7064 RepID=A0AAW1L2J4_POPJA